MATEWRIKRRGRVYIGVRTSDGKTQKRSTGYTERGNAEAVIRRWNREEADPSVAAARNATLSDAIRNFLNQNERRSIAEDTRDFYEEKCGHFLRIFGEHAKLSDIDAKAIDAYVTKRLKEPGTRGGPVKQHTVHKELVALRGVLDEAKRRGDYALDVRLVMPPKFSTKYEPRKTFLSRAQVAAYLDAMTPEMAAVVCFIIATSARRSEVGNARREDIDVKTWRVHLRGTKTEKSERTVPIEPWARPFLVRALRDAPGTGEVLFPSHWEWPYTSLRVAAARAVCPACDGTGLVGSSNNACPACEGRGTGVPYASPTDLRRTCATWTLAEGADLFDVSKLLGHADTTMVTRVYGRVDADMLRERLRRAGAGPVLDQETASAPDEVDPANITEAELMALLVGQERLELSANGLRGRRDRAGSSAKRRLASAGGRDLAQLRGQAWLLRGVRKATAQDEAGTLRALERAAAEFLKAGAA